MAHETALNVEVEEEQPVRLTWEMLFDTEKRCIGRAVLLAKKSRGEKEKLYIATRGPVMKPGQYGKFAGEEEYYADQAQVELVRHREYVTNVRYVYRTVTVHKKDDRVTEAQSIIRTVIVERPRRKRKNKKGSE